jgi:hypothetical protein
MPSSLIAFGHFWKITFRIIHLRKDRLGQIFQVENKGKFKIFRETVNLEEINESPVVLVVGFRLKIIGSNRALHWLFQRICILTTPFWAGFRDFHTKLWMVDPKTKNYLGIYQWFGEQNTQNYLDFLIPVLSFFSVKNSIWYKIYPNRELEEYLKSL